MGHDHSHQDLLAELTEHFQPVLDNAPEGVYLWLDPENLVCNEQLATMFGISVAEFARTTDFLGQFVDERDQEMFAGHYAKQIGHLQGPLRFRFRAKRKDGSTFDAETDMIPVGFGGHVVAYHFVRQV